MHQVIQCDLEGLFMASGCLFIGKWLFVFSSEFHVVKQVFHQSTAVKNNE